MEPLDFLPANKNRQDFSANTPTSFFWQFLFKNKFINAFNSNDYRAHYLICNFPKEIIQVRFIIKHIRVDR